MTFQPLNSIKITRFRGYKYSQNHIDKRFTIFIFYCIYIFKLFVYIISMLNYFLFKIDKEKIKVYKLKD